MNKIVEITVFDDGKDEFKDFVNRWIITKEMFNGGKVELTNMENKKIKINSISAWKTRRSQMLNTQNKLNVKKSNLINGNKQQHSHSIIKNHANSKFDKSFR